MIAFVLLALAAMPRPGEVLADLGGRPQIALHVLTATSTQLLTTSEAELYRMGEDAKAIARKARRELATCTKDLADERAGTKEAEKKVLEGDIAPAPEASSEWSTSNVLLLTAGVGIAAALGGALVAVTLMKGGI